MSNDDISRMIDERIAASLPDAEGNKTVCIGNATFFANVFGECCCDIPSSEWDVEAMAKDLAAQS